MDSNMKYTLKCLYIAGLTCVLVSLVTRTDAFPKKRDNDSEHQKDTSVSNQLEKSQLKNDAFHYLSTEEPTENNDGVSHVDSTNNFELTESFTEASYEENTDIYDTSSIDDKDGKKAQLQNMANELTNMDQLSSLLKGEMKTHDKSTVCSSLADNLAVLSAMSDNTQEQTNTSYTLQCSEDTVQTVIEWGQYSDCNDLVQSYLLELENPTDYPDINGVDDTIPQVSQCILNQTIFISLISILCLSNRN